jgi:hypothetical protein
MKTRLILFGLLAAWTALAQEAPAPAKTNAASAATDPANALRALRGDLVIESRASVFDLKSNQVVYVGNVRVEATNMVLRCDYLTSAMPAGGGKLERILARTNVVIDLTGAKGEKLRATSAQALYSYTVSGGQTNELIELTGDTNSVAFSVGDFVQWFSLSHKLAQRTDPVATHLWEQLSPETQETLTNQAGATADPWPVQAALVGELNGVLRGPLLHEAERFREVILRPETRQLLDQQPQGEALVRLNRLLLEDAYPVEISRNRGPLLDNPQGTMAADVIVYNLLTSQMRATNHRMVVRPPVASLTNAVARPKPGAKAPSATPPTTAKP